MTLDPSEVQATLGLLAFNQSPQRAAPVQQQQQQQQQEQQQEEEQQEQEASFHQPTKQKQAKQPSKKKEKRKKESSSSKSERKSHHSHHSESTSSSSSSKKDHHRSTPHNHNNNNNNNTNTNTEQQQQQQQQQRTSLSIQPQYSTSLQQEKKAFENGFLPPLKTSFDRFDTHDPYYSSFYQRALTSSTPPSSSFPSHPAFPRSPSTPYFLFPPPSSSSSSSSSSSPYTPFSSSHSHSSSHSSSSSSSSSPFSSSSSSMPYHNASSIQGQHPRPSSAPAFIRTFQPGAPYDVPVFFPHQILQSNNNKTSHSSGNTPPSNNNNNNNGVSRSNSSDNTGLGNLPSPQELFHEKRPLSPNSPRSGSPSYQRMERASQSLFPFESQRQSPRSPSPFSSLSSPKKSEEKPSSPMRESAVETQSAPAFRTTSKFSIESSHSGPLSSSSSSSSSLSSTSATTPEQGEETSMRRVGSPFEFAIDHHLSSSRISSSSSSSLSLLPETSKGVLKKGVCHWCSKSLGDGKKIPGPLGLDLCTICGQTYHLLLSKGARMFSRDSFPKRKNP